MLEATKALSPQLAELLELVGSDIFTDAVEYESRVARIKVLREAILAGAVPLESEVERLRFFCRRASEDLELCFAVVDSARLVLENNGMGGMVRLTDAIAAFDRNRNV